MVDRITVSGFFFFFNCEYFLGRRKRRKKEKLLTAGGLLSEVLKWVLEARPSRAGPHRNAMEQSLVATRERKISKFDR